MKANVGMTDQAARIVIGFGLLSLVVILEGGARWLGLIGLVPLATAVLSYCPLYSLLGMDTCPPEKEA
jgi:Protein of unknown function (DUF2892)